MSREEGLHEKASLEVETPSPSSQRLPVASHLSSKEAGAGGNC